MALVSNKCPNCGGKLKPLNRRSMVCPYCEAIYEKEDLEPLVSLKDSNVFSNNTINYTKNVTKPVRPVRHIEISEEGWASITVIGLFLMAFLVYGIMTFTTMGGAGAVSRFFSSRYATNQEYAAFPFSSDDVEDVVYSEVISKLEEAGFTNVMAVPSKPEGLWNQLVNAYNSTVKVSVEGEEAVSGKYYKKDSQVFVYYYAEP